MARAHWRLRLPCPQVSDPTCHQSDTAAAETKERQGGDRRCARQTACDLQHGQSARRPRPGNPDGGIRLRRSPVQRDRRLARRAADSGTTNRGSRRPSPPCRSTSAAQKCRAPIVTKSSISRVGRSRRLTPGLPRPKSRMERVQKDRSLGQSVETCSGSGRDQRYRQAACGDGRAGARRIFGARAAIGISHRSRQSWYSNPRGDGAVSPQIGAAGIELLQRRYSPERPCREDALKSAADAPAIPATDFATPLAAE
jgi:hypothetical protein